MALFCLRIYSLSNLHGIHHTVPYEGGGVELGVSVTGGGVTAGSFLLGRLSSSRVIPSSFVIPTTGGSPFLTNSHWPGYVSFGMFMVRHSSRTWQLDPSKPEGIPHNLFVKVALDLENDLVDSNSGGPMIESTLSFTHSHLCCVSHGLLPAPAQPTSFPLTNTPTLQATLLYSRYFSPRSLALMVFSASLSCSALILRWWSHMRKP